MDPTGLHGEFVPDAFGPGHGGWTPDQVQEYDEPDGEHVIQLFYNRAAPGVLSLSGGANMGGGLSLGPPTPPSLGEANISFVHGFHDDTNQKILELAGAVALGPLLGAATGAAEVAEDGAGLASLFHYTTEEGMNAILDSEELLPSLKAVNPADARYGDGQYFSDIIPGTRSLPSLSARFIRNPYQGQRFTHFIEINPNGLNVIQGRPGVFVIQNSGPLNLTGRILSSGPVFP